MPDEVQEPLTHSEPDDFPIEVVPVSDASIEATRRHGHDPLNESPPELPWAWAWRPPQGEVPLTDAEWRPFAEAIGIDPDTGEHRDDLNVIRQALYVAADTRLTDLCGLLNMKTSEAQAFRDRCLELHDAMRDDDA